MTDASRTSLVLAVGAACTLAASTAAIAADGPNVDNGVMTFEHVQVISAPGATAGLAVGSPAMRAFVDPGTGALRQPNPEELQTIAAEGAATTAALGRSARSAVSSVQSMKHVPGIRVMLDESQMQYMIVKRFDDGLMVEDCVTGEEQATAAAHQLTRQSAVVGGQEESR